MARSTGVFPREKFDLDAELSFFNTEGGEGEFDGIAAVDLKSINTIRVVVLGAEGLDEDSGDFDFPQWISGAQSEEPPNVVIAYIDGQFIYFWADDIDANGVGIKHVRGSLCGGSIFEEIVGPNHFAFAALGTTAVFSKGYIDAVENIG
jgi:hypothetical protein